MKILNHLALIKKKLFKNQAGTGKIGVLAWLLFLVCGIIYLIVSIRDRDPLMITGSICFVIAVILFLLPEGEKEG